MSPPRHALAALCGGGVVFALLYDACRPVASYDAWFHVATGRAIWEGGGALDADPFSHTFAGAPWPWQDWLADLVMAAFASAGPGGLVVFKLLCFAAAVAITTWSVRRWIGAEAGRSWIAIGAACVGGLSFRMLERPEALGYVVLAALLAELHAWWDTPASRDGSARWGPALRCVGWVFLNAQLHRGALVLPIVLFAFAVATRLAGRGEAGAPPWVAAAGGALALLATPFGRAVFGTSDALMSEYGGMKEFVMPTPSLLWTLTPWTLAWVAASILALLILVRRGVSANLWDLACLMMGLVLMSRGLRFAAYLPLFGALPVARALAPALTPPRELIACVGMTLALLGFVLTRPLPGPSLGVDPMHHPVAGIEFVREQRARGFLQGRAFNVSAYGGYLLSEFEGEVPVYVDGRVDLVYPPDFMRRSAQALVDPSVFAQEAARWDIEWVFIDNLPQRPAEGHFDLNPDWVLVHASTRALVYVRRDGPDAALIEAEGYEVLAPHFIAPSVESGLADPTRRAQTVAEVRRMYETDPRSPIAAAARARLVQAELLP